MALTAQQERFCIAYANGCSGSDAYRRAGYRAATDSTASTGAHRLLTKADVQTRIAEIATKAARDGIMTAREMQERLSSIIRGEVQGDGSSPTVRDMLRAIELLARMQGLFVARQEVSVQGAVPVVLVDDVGM